MDVFKRSIGLAIAALNFLLLAACSNPKPSSGYYVESSDDCASSAFTHQHIVNWVDGTRSVISGLNKDQVINEFIEENKTNIDFVEPDYRIQLDGIQTQTILLSNQDVNWGLDDIGAQEAWRRGATGEGVIVAVVDSGVDRAHSLLRSRIATNHDEVGFDANGIDKRFNGIDDDQNGLIDDYSGYDFLRKSGSVQDIVRHGTHVSGIIAAEHKGELVEKDKPQGVAPRAEILPLNFMDSQGGGSLSDALDAIQYAADRGAQVINASWGGAPCSASLGTKIASLAKKNILFVAAAGNGDQFGRSINIDQRKEYPASFIIDNQLTIGAITSAGGMTTFSNYGELSVHMFAPGEAIYSTLPGNTYGFLDGTSMATPFVSGAAAALLSYKPNATVSQIKAALLGSVTKNSTYRNQTAGRLNLAKALDALDQL